MKIDISHEKANVSININTENEPKFLGVFGPSGAGKTTMLRCLAGLEACCACNTDLLLKEQRIGMVAHAPTIFPHLNVRQNIMLGKKYEKRSRFGIEEVVTALDCKHLLHRSCDKLSAGEKQRIALARAIVNAPDVLLIDEVLSSFEAKLKTQVLDFLHTLTEQGIKIVLVSHHLPDLFEHADFLIQLNNGQVEWRGEVNELSRRPITSDTALDSIYSVVKRPEKPDSLQSSSYIAVNAQSVVIELPPVSQSSLVNCFEGRVSAIRTLAGDNIMVTIDINDDRVHALISAQALAKLNIVEQQNVAARF